MAANSRPPCATPTSPRLSFIRRRARTTVSAYWRIFSSGGREMVKKRIIPKFLIKGNRLVKGVRFHESFREAGNPVATAKVYDAYGVDELIFLDIEASMQNRSVIHDIIERVAEEVFMP